MKANKIAYFSKGCKSGDFGKELLEKFESCPDCIVYSLIMIPVVAPVSPISPSGRCPAWAASWRWRAGPVAWSGRLSMTLLEKNSRNGGYWCWFLVVC